MGEKTEYIVPPLFQGNHRLHGLVSNVRVVDELVSSSVEVVIRISTEFGDVRRSVFIQTFQWVRIDV